MIDQTELKAAKILLKRGVKVPVTAPLFFRIFGKKTINLVITAPTLFTLIKIAEKFCEMRIKDLKDLSLSSSFELLKLHHKTMLEIVGISILNDKKKLWRLPFLVRLLKNSLDAETLSYLFYIIIAYGGVEDFINTIRLAEVTKITKPMNLSPQEKTS